MVMPSSSLLELSMSPLILRAKGLEPTYINKAKASTRNVISGDVTNNNSYSSRPEVEGVKCHLACGTRKQEFTRRILSRMSEVCCILVKYILWKNK